MSSLVLCQGTHISGLRVPYMSLSAMSANWPLGARNNRITEGAACER